MPSQSIPTEFAPYKPGATYNDITLAQQEKARKFRTEIERAKAVQPEYREGSEPGDPDFDWAHYDDYLKTKANPVGDAQASLAGANKLSAETDAPGLLRVRPSLEALQYAADRERLPTAGEIGSAALEGTDAAAGITGMASLVPSPAQPFLAGTSLALAAPGAIKRLVAPDEGESRLGGAIESALIAAPASVRALRGLGGVVRGAEEAPVILRGAEAAKHAQESYAPGRRFWADAAELPYRMVGETPNPNQILEVAREIAAETGQPIETVLKQYAQATGGGLARAGGVRGGKGKVDSAALKALSELAHSADEANTPFKKMSRAGAFRGDRTTGHFEEGPGGLSSIWDQFMEKLRYGSLP